MEATSWGHATEPTPTMSDCYKLHDEDVNGNSPSERAIPPCPDDKLLCWLLQKKELAASWNSFMKSKQHKRRKCNQKEINFRSPYNILPVLSQKAQQHNDLIMTPKFEYDLLMNMLDENQDMAATINEQSFLKHIKSFQQSRLKRDPIPMGSVDDTSKLFNAPQYPYAFAPVYSYGNTKREIPESTGFFPSISAGSMTNLGRFFKDLSKNVIFSEKLELGEDEHKLLQGDHPLRVLQEKMNAKNPNTSKTAEFLQAIRSYRPSQKIRSLVAMNPEGYHGSHLIDPNYMWVGLGK